MHSLLLAGKQTTATTTTIGKKTRINANSLKVYAMKGLKHIQKLYSYVVANGNVYLKDLPPTRIEQCAIYDVLYVWKLFDKLLLCKCSHSPPLQIPHDNMLVVLTSTLFDTHRMHILRKFKFPHHFTNAIQKGFVEYASNSF